MKNFLKTCLTFSFVGLCLIGLLYVLYEDGNYIFAPIEYKQAVKYIKTGDYEAAIEELWNLDYRNSYELRDAIALYYVKTNYDYSNNYKTYDYESALSFLSDQGLISPNSIACTTTYNEMIECAKLYFEEDDYYSANALFSYIIQLCDDILDENLKITLNEYIDFCETIDFLIKL